MIELTINGEPIAKKRPRFVRRGKHVSTYNAQETEEGRFMAQVLHQYDEREVISDPVHVNFFFYRRRPKSHYGTGKNAGILKQRAPKWPDKKPDIDNYEKFALDCLNGIVLSDDAIVVSTQAIKAYAEKPKTIIQISLVEEAA